MWQSSSSLSILNTQERRAFISGQDCGSGTGGGGGGARAAP